MFAGNGVSGLVTYLKYKFDADSGTPISLTTEVSAAGPVAKMLARLGIVEALFQDIHKVCSLTIIRSCSDTVQLHLSCSVLSKQSPSLLKGCTELSVTTFRKTLRGEAMVQRDMIADFYSLLGTHWQSVDDGTFVENDESSFEESWRLCCEANDLLDKEENAWKSKRRSRPLERGDDDGAQSTLDCKYVGSVTVSCYPATADEEASDDAEDEDAEQEQRRPSSRASTSSGVLVGGEPLLAALSLSGSALEDASAVSGSATGLFSLIALSPHALPSATAPEGTAGKETLTLAPYSSPQSAAVAASSGGIASLLAAAAAAASSRGQRPPVRAPTLADIMSNASRFNQNAPKFTATTLLTVPPDAPVLNSALALTSLHFLAASLSTRSCPRVQNQAGPASLLAVVRSLAACTVSAENSTLLTKCADTYSAVTSSALVVEDSVDRMMGGIASMWPISWAGFCGHSGDVIIPTRAIMLNSTDIPSSAADSSPLTLNAVIQQRMQSMDYARVDEPPVTLLVTGELSRVIWGQTVVIELCGISYVLKLVSVSCLDSSDQHRLCFLAGSHSAKDNAAADPSPWVCTSLSTGEVKRQLTCWTAAEMGGVTGLMYCLMSNPVVTTTSELDLEVAQPMGGAGSGGHGGPGSVGAQGPGLAIGAGRSRRTMFR